MTDVAEVIVTAIAGEVALTDQREIPRQGVIANEMTVIAAEIEIAIIAVATGPTRAIVHRVITTAIMTAAEIEIAITVENLLLCCIQVMRVTMMTAIAVSIIVDNFPSSLFTSKCD